MAKLNLGTKLIDGIELNRINRMSRIMGALKLTQNFPLMKAVKIPASKFEELRAVVNLYLYACISRYHKNAIFTLSENILEKYPEKIKSLPNITPNGLILPKAEVILEYNLVHQTVASIFREFKFDKHLESVHYPINIRIVQGQPNPNLDGRPRSATKIHSDMWAGEPASAIMVFIPVFGDTENVGVRFCEPQSFPREIIRPLADFNEGAFLEENSKEYKVARFAKGQCILTDPFLLHQTVKNKPSLRLSIDFRFLARDKVKSDDYMGSTRLASYISMDDWCDYGKGRFLTTKAPLKKFTQEDVVNNDYAAKYETERLS
tara:strand:- start:167 stop:1123 length:957 start_codon:yes stop_codon:yes gene_type:complete